MVANVEWYVGELFLRLDYIVKNLKKSCQNAVNFHDGHGFAESRIEEGMNTEKWTKSFRCYIQELPDVVATF